MPVASTRSNARLHDVTSKRLCLLLCPCLSCTWTLRGTQKALLHVNKVHTRLAWLAPLLQPCSPQTWRRAPCDCLQHVATPHWQSHQTVLLVQDVKITR